MREFASYWRTLLSLALHPKTTVETVDIPFELAVTRAKWATLWTVCVIWLTTRSIAWTRLRHWFGRIDSTHPSVSAWICYVLCGLIAIPLAYGFLRLYTLVTHVLTLNVFKVRGQRLRLLNLETKLLSMSAPVCVIIWIHHFAAAVGIVLWLLAAVALLWHIALGYNHIFHRTGVAGLLLFIGGSLVTWFVLCIGALAIIIMAAVLAFFVILILRSFHRT